MTPRTPGRTPRSAPTPTGPTPHDGPLRRAVLSVPLVPVAAGLAVVVVALGVLGYLEDSGDAPALFDLDGEGKPPAALAALLLLLAGSCGVAIGRRTGERAWGLLGAFLVFMAVDEALTLHETLSDATGVGWIKLYLPLAAVGGVAWLVLLRRLWSAPLLRAGWVGGAAAWFVSQVLEHLQSGPGGRVEGYSLYSTAEECLELTGSALWLLVLVVVLRQRLTEDPAPTS